MVKAGSAAYDLILMDIRMPIMDGLASDCPHSPASRMWSAAHRRDDRQCFRRRQDPLSGGGMNDFVTKPVDPVALFETCSAGWTGESHRPGRGLGRPHGS